MYAKKVTGFTKAAQKLIPNYIYCTLFAVIFQILFRIACKVMEHILFRILIDQFPLF
jgi:hypothetical protein